MLTHLNDLIRCHLLGKLKMLYRKPLLGEFSNISEPSVVPATIVIIVGPNFSVYHQNASTKCRIGWMNGAKQLGLNSCIISAGEISDRLSDISNPICWIAGTDYIYLSRSSIRTLRNYKHIVWVPTKFKGDAEYYASIASPNLSVSDTLMRKILSSYPQWIFTISPEASFEYYDDWLKSGAKLISLPLACDTHLYNYDSAASRKYPNVDLAFVGGYWGYKSRQLDKYLKPLSKLLTVYGYTTWPYGKYSGVLDDHDEKYLY